MASAYGSCTDDRDQIRGHERGSTAWIQRTRANNGDVIFSEEMPSPQCLPREERKTNRERIYTLHSTHVMLIPPL